MAIQPVKLALPTPPPPSSGRPSVELPATPVASQSGVSAVAGDESIKPTQSGTTTALIQQAAPGERKPDARDAADRKTLVEAVERAQEAVNAQVRDFSFSIHDKTGEIVVRIIDRESKEVIRQIPAEEMLRIAENLQNLEGKNQPGMLLKQEI